MHRHFTANVEQIGPRGESFAANGQAIDAERQLLRQISSIRADGKLSFYLV